MVEPPRHQGAKGFFEGGWEEGALRQFPVGYSTVRIPKRDGSARVLQVPQKELKTLQRKLLRRVLAKLAAHPAAMGFERGASSDDCGATEVRICEVLRGAARLKRRVGWRMMGE